jgi:CDP-diacylglycerol--glycerol-3-phosphate 3-phosphatidyltransferase
MNLPNLLTLARIPLMFVIVGLLYCTWWGAATLAFGLFIISALTDWWDGALARRRGQVSNFGVFMDALTDKISVLGLLLAAVDRKLIMPESDAIPVFLLLVILTREFMITGLRLVAASRGVMVAAEKAGKQKTVTQLIALGIFFAIPMLERDLDVFTGANLCAVGEWLRHLGFWLLLVATFLTLRSGALYFIKYGPLIFGPGPKE